MPDISMCANEDCPSKLDCYRFTAKPSGTQSWGIFDFGGGDCCENYIPNGNSDAPENKA